MSDRLGLVALLVVLGAGRGATQPLTKVAVATGHGPMGLIFWQFVVGAVRLGTLLPNSASLLAARHLPAEVLSIAVAAVPMLAYPPALVLGTGRCARARAAGLFPVTSRRTFTGETLAAARGAAHDGRQARPGDRPTGC